MVESQLTLEWTTTSATKHKFIKVVYRVPTWIISFGLQLSVQLQEGDDMEKKNWKN